MGDLSIIELAIYLFIELFSLSMLILTVIKDVPTGKSSSIVRVIYLIPGIFASGILSYTGQDIPTGTVTTIEITRNLNSSEVWNTTNTQIFSIGLVNPVWITFHFMIMVVLMVYVFITIVSMLTKKE